MTLYAPPVTRKNASYHQGMTQQHIPAPVPPPVPPYPPPGKPPTSRAPWVIFASILAAGVLIAGAILLTSGKGENTVQSTAPGSSATAAANDISSSATCVAWRPTEAALDRIPLLAAGWGWDTPGIDETIASIGDSVTTALDMFEPKINPADPPVVVNAARDYVAAKRNEIEKLKDRTFTGSDGVAVTVAFTTLKELCSPAGTKG